MTMFDFSPPSGWYEPPEDDETHNCKGVWCLDASHQEYLAPDECLSCGNDSSHGAHERWCGLYSPPVPRGTYLT